jgi:CRISPR/Cas system-associated exonuclease Cas4 (RecB family)
MPQQGFHCIVDFVDVSFDECIGCAATRGRCQFTASLLRGMADQAGQRDDRSISVTALTGCVRQAYLQATRPYHRRPDHQYWAYRGTIGHTMAERGAGEGTIAEQRFERELALPSGRTLTITGQPDEIVPARKLLVEYKTADRPPRAPSVQHIAQLNCYRWLVAPDHEIATLGIVYLTMREVKKVAVPIWPDGQAERFLAERAASLADALEGGAWPAMTEDRWMCRYCPVAATCEAGPDGGSGTLALRDVEEAPIA